MVWIVALISAALSSWFLYNLFTQLKKLEEINNERAEINDRREEDIKVAIYKEFDLKMEEIKRSLNFDQNLRYNLFKQAISVDVDIKNNEIKRFVHSEIVQNKKKKDEEKKPVKLKDDGIFVIQEDCL